MKIALRVGCLTCGEEVVATGGDWASCHAAIIKHGWRVENLRLGYGHCPSCHGLDSNEKPHKPTQTKELPNE